MYQNPFNLVHSGQSGAASGRFIFFDLDLNRVGLVQLGESKVRTKRSGVLLSVHLACALLEHFAIQVRTLSILRLALFPSGQGKYGHKTQHLCPTHTTVFDGAYYEYGNN
jgi:hypothetical protein